MLMLVDKTPDCGRKEYFDILGTTLVLDFYFFADKIDAPLVSVQ